MRQSLLFISVIVFFVLLVGCDDNSVDFNSPIITAFDNTPVVANTLNAYTFTVSANDFALTRVDSLSFDTDSLVVTLTLASHSSGGGDISVVTANSTTIFSESLNANKVLVKTDVIGNIPKAVSVQMSDFTGSVSFVLAKQE